MNDNKLRIIKTFKTMVSKKMKINERMTSSSRCTIGTLPMRLAPTTENIGSL